ncbi:hypothetical protein POM88_023752 [Heracleum sosnowskyi]|uniref:Uncharacterized protein n=1 Tax=Heracleum sosnowskyi TaxID=360622 RepID=A0AAD8IHL5_9APIA|nr:hypothetical protein POM88_023752 [Heracleum sosnowskyi]
MVFFYARLQLNIGADAATRCKGLKCLLARHLLFSRLAFCNTICVWLARLCTENLVYCHNCCWFPTFFIDKFTTANIAAGCKLIYLIHTFTSQKIVCCPVRFNLPPYLSKVKLIGRAVWLVMVFLVT